jgi:putative MATE family efflux protein
MRTWIWKALKGEELTYTSMSLRRSVVLLSVPMVAEMLMESLFAVVDVFYVARLGSRAIAVVGITESVLTLVYSLGWGLSMGATAVVARRIGEKRREDAAYAAAQTLWLGLGLSVLLGALGIVVAPHVLSLMSSDAALVSEGSAYIRIMLAGNGSILLLFMINAVFRGAGDASLAMRTLWLANGINMVLDPILIFGLGPIPGWGLEGAAMASVIGRSAGIGYQLWHLFRGRHRIELARRHLVWAWELVRQQLKIGILGAGQFLIASASWIFLMRIVAVFGPDALAGYTISIRVMVFTILPAWGMANAASTLVGQHLGAGQPALAASAAWLTARYAMLFMLIVAMGYLLAAEPLVGFFTEEPAVIAYGASSLRIISLGYLFYAYGMVISQAFNGAGDTRTPMLINLVGFWLVEIPLAWILAIPMDMGPVGVFIAVALAESLVALACIYYFRKGNWQKTHV